MMDDLVAVRPDGSIFTPVHWMHHETQRIACTPNMPELHAANGRAVPYPRTLDVQATTCPRCKATADYKAAQEQYQAAMRRQGR